MKTICTTILILLLVMTAPTHAAHWLEGEWRGTIMLEETALHLTYSFFEEDGKTSGHFDVPSWVLDETAVPGIEVTGQKLRMRVPYGSAALTLLPETMDLVGKVSNDSGEYRMHLRKLSSIPREPLQTLRHTVMNGNISLSTIIVLPDTPGPHPAMIYLHGRSDGRKESLLTRANYFARRGVAGILFDRRGEGGSSGSKEETTIHHYIDDAIAIYDFARTRGELEPTQIGAFSWSSGGWILPALGNRRQELAFAIMCIGPAERLSLQQAHVAYAYAAMRFDMPEELAKQAEAHYQAVLDYIFGRKEWQEVIALQNSLAGTPVEKALFKVDDRNDPEFAWIRRNEHDHESELVKMTTPLLALYGEEDFVVPPEVNTTKLEKYLEQAGNQNYEIHVLPGVGHSLGFRNQQLELDGKEITVPQRMSPLFVELIEKWLLERDIRLR